MDKSPTVEYGTVFHSLDKLNEKPQNLENWRAIEPTAVSYQSIEPIWLQGRKSTNICSYEWKACERKTRLNRKTDKRLWQWSFHNQSNISLIQPKPRMSWRPDDATATTTKFVFHCIHPRIRKQREHATLLSMCTIYWSLFSEIACRQVPGSKLGLFRLFKREEVIVAYAHAIHLSTLHSPNP